LHGMVILVLQTDPQLYKIVIPGNQVSFKHKTMSNLDVSFDGRLKVEKRLAYGSGTHCFVYK